jgi:hypothetical protein
MKENYRRLSRIMKIFGWGRFYAITIYDSSIVLQGKFNTTTLKLAISLRFKYRIDSSGYVNLTRGYYNICLTD